MFERPIQNGLCVDSTAKDKRVMMHRSHVLYHELKGFVQRRSHAVLKETLPQKTEHVILIKMTPIQKQLYSTFMNQMVLNAFVTANPLKAFAVCCKIWNHPDVLYNFLRKKETSSLFDLDIEPEELGVSASGIGENLDSPKKKINLDENSSEPKRQSNQVQEKELLTNELINH
jgi:RAD54-like protein 2